MKKNKQAKQMIEQVLEDAFTSNHEGIYRFKFLCCKLCCDRGYGHGFDGVVSFTEVISIKAINY